MEKPKKTRENQRKHSAALFGCRKEQLRPIAMIVLVAMVLTLLPFSAFAEVGSMDTTDGTTINLLDGKSDVVTTTPSGIFSNLKLTISNSVEEQQGKLGLQFNFALSDEEKLNVYNQATSGSVYDFDEYKDINPGIGYSDYLDYLNERSDEELSPIYFSFILKSDMGIDLQDKMQADVKTSNEEVLGHFFVTQQEDNSLLFECELNKSLYDPDLVKVSGSGNFGVQFTREDLGDENPVLKWDEETGEVIIEFPGASKVDLSGTEFTVDKETIGSTCDSFHKHLPQEAPDLSYTVTLTSAKKENSNVEQVYLNGLLFKDTIPEGLKVTAVEVQYVNADGSTEWAPLKNYSITADNVLTYTLPNEPANMTQAKFKISTWLNETEYNKYLNNYDNKTGLVKYDKNFTNKAELIMQDGSDKVLGTDSVTDTIRHTFMMKDGEPKGIDGKKFSWKLDISAYFQDSSNVYLVDYIDNTAVHRFNAKTAGLTVTRDGVSNPVPVTGLDNKGADYKYDSLTLEKLNGLNITAGQAVCYTVKPDQQPTQQVLIVKLPQDWCKGAFSLRYETDIQANVAEGARVKNSAKLMWESVTGPGGGSVTPPTWSVNVDKGLSGNNPIVQKRSAGYDPRTQHLHWQFDVNHYGNNLEDVTITDTFDAKKYQLVEDKNHTHKADEEDAHQEDVLLQVGKHPIQVGVHNRLDGSEGVPISIPYMESGSANENYYNVQQDGNKLKLTIHFKDVPEDKMYRIIVHAKVCNKQDLIDGATVKNTAQVSAKVGDSTVEQNTNEASQKVSSRMFDKWCSRAYHGKSTNDQEIRWRLRINTDNLPLNNIVVTDTLPEGTVFNGFNGAQLWMGGKQVYNTTAPTDKEIVFSAQGFKVVLDETKTTTTADGKQQITFKITDLNGNPVETKYEILVFVRTRYTDDYRKDHFKHNQEITAVNNATLNATVYGEEFNLDAQETTTFMPNLVNKSGTYYPYTADKPAYMDWTVRVNEGQVELGAESNGKYEPAQIIDNLHPSLELDKKSFTISTVVTTDGTVTKTAVADDFNFEDYLYTQGFAIPIPKEYRNQTLELNFRTNVVNDMQASEMKNRVTLRNPQQGDYDADSSANGAQNFSLSAMIEASRLPALTVYKISTQDVAAKDNAKAKEHVAISGAEFTLTEGAMNKENNSWTEADSAVPVQKTTTVGKATFLRLKVDTVYRLEEKTAPDGYEKTEESLQYLVFTENPEKYQNATVDNKALKVYTLQSNNVDSFKTSITITNKPTKGSIVGHKVDDADAPVKGALLGLYKASPSQVEGELVEKDRLQLAESDEHGQFSFAGLKAGTYVIKEVRAPEGFYLSDEIVTVNLSNDDCQPDAAPVTVDIGKNPIKIVDKKIPSAGSVKGKKVDANQKPLAGAEFTLTCEHGIEHKAVSNAKGVFQFNNLQPATYTLKETKAPEGYELTDKEYKVELKDTDCTVQANGEPPASVEVDIDKNALTFVNQRAAGFGGIEGKKLAKENSQPLAGAVIGLFAADDEEDNDHSGDPKYTCTTDADGVFRFYDLTPGEYHVKEIKAPEGYKLNENPLYAKLSEEDCRNGVTVTVDHSGYDLVIWNELINTPKPPVTEPEEPVTPPSGGNGGGETIPPVKPTDPTDPTTPTEPVEPENPEQPTEPVEPENPEQPTEPVAPEQPEYPTELPDPNAPDSPDEITIWDDGVPITYVKMWDPETEKYIYIPETEVPIANAKLEEPNEPIGDAPATGDHAPTTVMLFLLAASAAGLRVVTRKETE